MNAKSGKYHYCNENGELLCRSKPDPASPISDYIHNGREKDIYSDKGCKICGREYLKILKN